MTLWTGLIWMNTWPCIWIVWTWSKKTLQVPQNTGDFYTIWIITNFLWRISTMQLVCMLFLLLHTDSCKSCRGHKYQMNKKTVWYNRGEYMQISANKGKAGRKKLFSDNITHTTPINLNWTEGRQEVWKLEEKLEKDAVCHQFCSTCTANALPRKLWKGLETLNGRANHSPCEICRWPCVTG